MELDVFELFIWEDIGGTPVNRVIILMALAALLTMGFFWLGARKRAMVPTGIQYFAETGYLFVRNNIAIDVIGREGARYATYLAALFWFIFFSNLLEIVPLVNFPVTSRMAIPAALALLSWIIFNFVGIRRHGLGYFKDTLFPPGVPWPIYIILTPIEFLSVFIIRPLTLAIRLFANMMAGHVLLTIFFLFTEELLLHGNILGKGLSVVTFLVACLLVIFEFMVITIQAYIFTTLSAFYIAEALHGHGDEGHEEVQPHDDLEDPLANLEGRRETELVSA